MTFFYLDDFNFIKKKNVPLKSINKVNQAKSRLYYEHWRASHMVGKADESVPLQQKKAN